jgi:hypothetical protein
MGIDLLLILAAAAGLVALGALVDVWLARRRR